MISCAVATRDGKTKLDWPEDVALGNYICVVRNPFSEANMMDGYVQRDTNFVVIEDLAKFDPKTLPRFAFFANHPSTVGLLTGHAAANGNSSQQLFMADVETGASVLIPLANGRMPLWLGTNCPPPFFELNSRSYGPDGETGGNWRPDHAYRFSGGKYLRDLATEQHWMAAKFKAAQLSPAERQSLRVADESLWNKFFSPDVKALCDFLYYGIRSGNRADVARLIATLRPGLQKRANRFVTAVAEDSESAGEATSEPAEQAALTHVVVKGDTLYSIARRYKITVKALKASNPGITQEALKIGAKLAIPIGIAPCPNESALEHSRSATPEWDGQYEATPTNRLR